MNSFIIMPYKNPYEKIYKELLEPILIKEQFRVYRADQIGNGKPILENVREGIRAADLVVILNDPNNGNVLFELGQANILDKEIILIIDKKDSNHIPTDINNLSHLIIEHDNLDNYNNDFTTILKNTNAYRRIKDKRNKDILNRGDILPNITDAVIYLEDYNKPLSRQIIDQLGNESHLDFRFLYQPDIGTLSWLELCSDATYYYKDTVENLKKVINKIIGKIDQGVLSQAPDYISLGCGDGQKDSIILNAISKSFKNELRCSYYYPCDINNRMLSHAIRRVKNQKSLNGKVFIKAFQGDFKNIQTFKPVYDYRKEPNIFSILGNTLGNIRNEIEFLSKLKGAMNVGDYLIVEIRIYTDEHSIAAGGSENSRKNFNTAPLNYINAKFSDNDVMYIKRTMASPIPKTQTIDCICSKVSVKNKTYQNLHLGIIHHYNSEQFEAYISEEAGFEVVMKDINKDIGTGVFLLRKLSEC